MTSRLLLLSVATLLVPCALAEKPMPVAATQPKESAPSATQPTEAPQPDIFVELRCITLPQNLAVPIIQKFRSAARKASSDAAADLERLIAQGDAKLLGWPIAKTHAGQEANVQDAEEIHYASAFSPGSVNVYLADDNGNLTKQPSTVSAADVEPVATQFETRLLGISLKVKPTISTIGEIDVELQAEHVQLSSVDRISIIHEFTTEKKTQKVTQEQPRFLTMKVSTTASVESGEQMLLGIFKAPGENQLELFVLGATIQKSDKSAGH